MQANEFDTALRNRFEAWEPEYNPVTWTQLEQKLSPNKSGKRFILIPLALGLAASAALASVWIFRSGPLEKPKTMASTLSPISGNSGKSGLPFKQSIAPTILHKLTAANSIPGNQNTIQSGQVSYTAPATYKDSARSSITEITANNSEKGNDAPKIKTVPYDLNPGWMEETPSNHAKKSPAFLVSLSAGLQYGNLNAGYSANIQVQHSLGARWSLEADMGFLRYGANGTQQASEADINNFKNLNMAGQGTVIDINTRHAPINYLTAAPVVRFHLLKRWSIGAGMDIQRGLVDQGYKSFLVDDGVLKVLPAVDFGARASLQYHLSGLFETGVLYRQGMNNLLQPGNTYLDRHYLEIQLKVPLSRH